MRGRVRRSMLTVLLIILAVAVWGPAASADTSTVKSEPNGDLEVTVSVGCSQTDKDGDGDGDTCTQGDKVSLFFSVFNLSSDTQTVRIDYELDGPGDDLDQAFTQEVVLEPDDSHQERDELKIKPPKHTPLGEYTLTVTASGSETATASASFTVEPRK